MALPALAGLLLAGLGTGVSLINQQQAASRQRRATQQAGERQRDRQRQTQSVIEEQIARLRAPNRIGMLDTAEAEIGKDLQRTVQQNQGAGEEGLSLINQTGTGGRISGAARKKAQGATAKRAQGRADIARLLSRIEAPSALARAEGKDFSNLAIANQLQSNFAQGDAFVDQQRINQAGQPNALLGFLGGAAQGVGSSLIANPGGLAGLLGGQAPAPVDNRDIPRGF